MPRAEHRHASHARTRRPQRAVHARSPTPSFRHVEHLPHDRVPDPLRAPQPARTAAANAGEVGHCSVRGRDLQQSHARRSRLFPRPTSARASHRATRRLGQTVRRRRRRGVPRVLTRLAPQLGVLRLQPIRPGFDLFQPRLEHHHQHSQLVIRRRLPGLLHQKIILNQDRMSRTDTDTIKPRDLNSHRRCTGRPERTGIGWVRSAQIR
jgi:hypothetical protein